MIQPLLQILHHVFHFFWGGGKKKNTKKKTPNPLCTRETFLLPSNLRNSVSVWRHGAPSRDKIRPCIFHTIPRRFCANTPNQAPLVRLTRRSGRSCGFNGIRHGNTTRNFLLVRVYVYINIYTWNLKHLFVNGCFNWMIPNLYLGNGCFTKHPFKTGCLGYIYVHTNMYSTTWSCQAIQNSSKRVIPSWKVLNVTLKIRTLNAHWRSFFCPVNLQLETCWDIFDLSTPLLCLVFFPCLESFCGPIF